MDILIAVAQAIIAAIAAYLGVHLTLHPPGESKSKILGYKIGFVSCGLVAVVLIGIQTYRNDQAQSFLKDQLGRIETNTKDPPRVQVNVPPSQVVIAQPPQTAREKSQSEYSNEQIKDAALGLARRLREFQQSWMDDEMRVIMGRQIGGSDPKEAFTSFQKEMLRIGEQHQATFGPLRAEAKNVIFHLQSRVPAPQPQPSELLKFALLNGSGPNPASTIADYVDQLALLVPTKR